MFTHTSKYFSHPFLKALLIILPNCSLNESRQCKESKTKKKKYYEDAAQKGENKINLKAPWGPLSRNKFGGPEKVPPPFPHLSVGLDKSFMHISMDHEEMSCHFSGYHFKRLTSINVHILGMLFILVYDKKLGA